MHSKLIVSMVVFANGCERHYLEPRFEGPMPIAFGDCAAPTVSWVSGPRPAPFTQEAANGSDRTRSDAKQAPRVRTMFRADAPSPDAERYTPGAANPLRGETAALADCFRVNPKHQGNAVIELAYDAAGSVTRAVTYGVGEAARACLVRVARTVKRTGAGPAAQRCSLTFGEMPLAELPAIDIAFDAIAFDGVTVVGSQAVMTDTRSTSKIPQLVAPVQARLRAALEANVPIVSSHGPLVLRPIDAMPMKLVTRVIGSVLAAGGDFVLAARRGPQWQLLSPMRLPIAPVPFGTGARWSRVAGDVARPGGVDEHVIISVLVQKKRTWIGMSRINDFQELDRDNPRSQSLLDALADRKASRFFRGRSDLEVAAEDDVSYGELTAVIDAVTQAGFSEWRLTTPSRLSVTPF